MERRENTEAQRRAQAIIARHAAKTARIQKIEQNGITIADLEREYKLGYDTAFNAGAEPMYRSMMAAICLALHELHGFSKKRLKAVLQAVDEKVLYTLTTDEAVDEVFKKTGLEILFHEPFDRIVEREDA